MSGEISELVQPLIGANGSTLFGQFLVSVVDRF
ncbi:hypothetical protein N601_14030 [Rhodococcus erythropolis DN1]|nr:hypothetical protein N601_14030 [Rhodococcus erythropolis DN1]